MTNDVTNNKQNSNKPPIGKCLNGLNIFLTAIMFYTRIPVRRNIGYSKENLNKATKFFPLVGLIVGAIGAAVFYITSLVLPNVVSVILSFAATVFVTGAFHEDGFADFCDGFGGGYTPEKIITIMKDSRIGTYGSIGLLLIMLIKIASVSSMETRQIPLIIIAAHGLSRVMPVMVIFTSNYVLDDITSKIKPIGRRGKFSDLIIATVFGSIFLILFHWKFLVIIIPVLLICTWLFRIYITKKIGGYTGDCLGALQQLCETLIYLSFIVSTQI